MQLSRQTGFGASQRRRPMPYPVTVAAVHRSGPRTVRVTFDGDGLRPFRWPGPASHLKVFLPEPGRRTVELPPADDDGFMATRPGAPRPVTRTFTPLRWDAAAGRLDVEFLMHGHGPAAQWAAQARPGDRLAVSQPRRTYEVLPDSRWLLLAGDESALPALATLLPVLDADLDVRVLVEVEQPDYPVGLPDHPRGDLRQVSRSPSDRPGGPLLEAITGCRLPSAPGQVWVACEATAVRAIRAHLLAHRSLPRDRVLTRGYWRDGHPNHPDHDYGEDPL